MRKKTAKQLQKEGVKFSTELGLFPREKGFVFDLAQLKIAILRNIEEFWGPRCKTKDYEDFPELDPIFAIGDPEAGRCPVCLVYEKFDAFWEQLDFEKRGETVSS